MNRLLMDAIAVTRRDIQEGIRSLRLCERPVCLHSSLSSFGNVEGGAVTVVEAFLQEGCTLLVPSFSWSFAVPPPLDLK
jgi:aminoglycoside 3-N-acetyltransferase